MRRAKVVELPLVPGARTDDTDLAAKLQAVDMDKVRTRLGRWETIKGWSQFSASGMTSGVPRGGHTWSTLDGNKCLIAGSAAAINAWVDGTRFTITPKWADIFLSYDSVSVSTNSVEIVWAPYDPVTDTSTSAPHFLQVGDTITISGWIGDTGGGAYTLNGTHTISEITSPTNFKFVTSGNAPNQSDEGGFSLVVNFRSGNANGTADTVADLARVYAFDNYGENAVFCGSDGTPIFYWQPATSYSAIISDAFSSTGVRVTLGAGWGISGGTANHTGGTAGNLSYDVNDILTGGKTYELSFDVASVSDTGTIDVFIDSIKIRPNITHTTADDTTVQTYTSRFVCPADPTSLIFTADNTISIDNVSVTLLSIAHPINEAPSVNRALFADGNNVLHVLGSVEADGDFNPRLWRWCAQDNYRDWVPDTDNIAGEYTLGNGSMAVGGSPVGDINLLFTDDAAFMGGFTAAGYTLVPLGTGCGLAGCGALTVHNNSAFWTSGKGFFFFDGAQVRNLECPVKDRFIGKVKQYQENKTFAWLNVEYNEVWFHFAHTDDGTEISRYVGFNFLEQGNPWFFGTFNRTTFCRSSIYQSPISFDSSGAVWSHETGTSFSGSGITLPFIETGYITGGDGDRWLGLRRYYPDMEGQTGNVLFTVTGKRSPQGQLATQTIGPLPILPDQRTLDFLLAARQLKFKWASETTPTMWRLGVVGLEVVSERERR